MTNEQFEQFMSEIGQVFNKWSLGEALVYVRDEPAKKDMAYVSVQRW